jgi:hypothetical protein
MENDTSIVLIGNASLPVDVQLTDELKRLSTEIIKGQNELRKTLDNIDKKVLPIDIKRNWIGAIKKSSIEETCKNIYSNLSEYIKDCGRAIQKTNDNLGSSLNLIKLLAVVEKDLYEQIDNQAVHNNELKAVFLEWCQSQGINDQEMRDLLETCFNRAYILRDRINSLRNEFRNGIEELTETVGLIEKKQKDLDERIAEIINNFTLTLQNILDEKLLVFEGKKQEFESVYQDKYKHFLMLANEKEELLNKILEENMYFKERIESQIKSLRRKVLYAILGSLSFSGLVSYLIVTLLN